MNKVYTEDIKTAINLAKEMPVEVVSNLFRFNERQTEAVRNGKTGQFTSINAKSVRGSRKKPVALTPRMVEAAATLNYIGWTHKDIADVYGCDNTTVAKRLANYHGYKGSYRIEVQ